MSMLLDHVVFGFLHQANRIAQAIQMLNHMIRPLIRIFFTASILITFFAPQMLEHGGFSAEPFMQLAASEPKPLCTHLLFY